MTVEGPARRPSRSVRTVLVGVLVVVVVLAAVVASQVIGDEAPTGLEQAPPALDTPSLQERPDPGDQFALPDVTLAGFGGGPTVDTASYRGKPLVLNFWATWCAPCVREMPDFQTVAAATEGEVAFLGVDVMDAASNAEPFVKRLGITYDLAADLKGEYWKEVRSFAMPTTLFVAPDGTVVYRQTGPLDEARLRALMNEHLDVPLT